MTLTTQRPGGQQYVRNRMRHSYTAWLDIVFNSPPEVAARSSFWIRHSHDTLVARWAGIVGADNVTVIVVDDTDKHHVSRTFEQLTGLPAGLLVPVSGRENRSLTRGETELIRYVNLEFYRRRRRRGRAARRDRRRRAGQPGVGLVGQSRYRGRRQTQA